MRGEFFRYRITEVSRPGRADAFSAPALLALAGALDGAAPPVFAVTAGMARSEMGTELSPTVEAALPAVTEAVARLVNPDPDGSGR